VLPAFAIASAWLLIEEPARAGEALVIAAVALVPAVITDPRLRALALVGATVVVACRPHSPWRHPVRDDTSSAGVSAFVCFGIADFADRSCLRPGRYPEMHSLTLVACSGCRGCRGSRRCAPPGRRSGRDDTKAVGRNLVATTRGDRRDHRRGTSIPLVCAFARRPRSSREPSRV
jgi:hypothetical protein